MNPVDAHSNRTNSGVLNAMQTSPNIRIFHTRELHTHTHTAIQIYVHALVHAQTARASIYHTTKEGESAILDYHSRVVIQCHASPHELSTFHGDDSMNLTHVHKDKRLDAERPIYQFSHKKHMFSFNITIVSQTLIT